jgi:YVTN family beta-propeller protein
VAEAQGVIGALAGLIAAVAIPLFALGGGADRMDLGDPSNSVGVLDAGSGAVKDAVELPMAPTAVAAGLGYVWAASAGANAVFAIDPETNTLRQRIAVGNTPGGIAVGGGYVWVTNSLEGTVSQIDPRALIELQKIRVGNGPTGVAFGGGHVWVVNTTDHTISKIRARTGKLLKTYTTVTDPGAVAVGKGAVWVASKSSGSVVRLNPRNAQQLKKIVVGGGPTAVTVGLGKVWVANSADRTVAQIDPASESVVDVDKVGANPSGLGVVRGEVWSTNELDGTVSRIDPATDRPTTVRLGGRPTAVVAADGIAYVALRPVGAAHRGGTLRVALLNIDPLGTTLDPALASFDMARFLSLTGDRLLTYRQVAGEAGNELEPDLAVAMPYLSSDRKTYTFQLRPNVRYSNGELVRATDVRRTFERLLRLRGAEAGFDELVQLHAIRGAQSCDRRRCDLSAGIVADNAAGTVMFRLNTPDPIFLHKLAATTATIIPAGTPLREAKRRPIPATGPYRIASFDPNHSVRLVRNPRFREWSNAAQPAGYPDEIVGEVVPAQEQPIALRLRGQKKRIALVEHGQADLTSSHGAVPFLPGVSAPFLPLVHGHPRPVTFYLAFNVKQPPFDDPRARQAINYALDRDRVAQLAAGEDENRPTCQVIPPNFPAHRRYCPYTRDPQAEGGWTTPDRGRATRLVEASGTAGAPVTLWVPRDPAGIGLGKYLKELLDGLGYRVRLRSSFTRRIVCSGSPRRCERMSPAGAYFTAYFTAVAKRKPLPEILWSGWAADYPGASNFIQPLFSCRGDFNIGHFCDLALDRRIGRALQLQQTDIAGANRLWAHLDRVITNKGAWVPLYNVYGADLVSRRVGNYQYNPWYGALLSQLWVR